MGIIAASIPLFFLLIGVELLAARLGHRPFYRLNDSISDLSAGTLSQLAGIFTKVLLVGAYGWTFEATRLQHWLPLGDWPDGAWFTRAPTGTLWHADAIAGWVVAFVAVDFAYYWFHRVSHEVNLFWAGHVVHHSSEEYNLAVALRQTALGGVLSWLFYMPLAALGLPLAQFATCYALNLVYQFWIHTRAIGRLPHWAESVLNTPSHHRVHHGVNPEYQDRNYAGVFIVWDRWFGTFTPEREEPVYGLTTPLRSWNPLWAQVHQYVAIARAVRRAGTWGDRWRAVFGPPAWRPASEGGPVPIPDVSRDTSVVYDPAVPRVLTAYALAQFAAAIPAALWLLREAATLPWLHAGAGVFVVALTLTNVGGVLEARRWAFAAEQARLGALLAAAAGAAASGSWPAGLTAGIAILAAGSLAALWALRAHFTGESDEGMDAGGHAHRA